jgi:subfamily B ATP-binding cassette protein HlyB/CyaB
MSVPSNGQNYPEAGLAALVVLLCFHEIGADREQILHRFGAGGAFGTTEMLRCAKAFGLKARLVTTGWARLARVPCRPSRPCAAGAS